MPTKPLTNLCIYLYAGRIAELISRRTLNIDPRIVCIAPSTSNMVEQNLKTTILRLFQLLVHDIWCYASNTMRRRVVKQNDQILLLLSTRGFLESPASKCSALDFIYSRGETFRIINLFNITIKITWKWSKVLYLIKLLSDQQYCLIHRLWWKIWLSVHAIGKNH